MVEDRKADPPSAVDGLEGIEKRVGSWGKKVKAKVKVKVKKQREKREGEEQYFLFHCSFS